MPKDLSHAVDGQNSETPRLFEPSPVDGLLGAVSAFRAYLGLEWRRTDIFASSRHAFDSMLIRFFSPEGKVLQNVVHLLYEHSPA